MTIDAKMIGLSVGTDVRQTERSIRMALRDLSALTISTIEAGDVLSVGSALTHPALAGFSSSFSELVKAHASVTKLAHPALERMGRFAKLDETDWGGSGQKPPARAQDTTTEPSVETA